MAAHAKASPINNGSPIIQSLPRKVFWQGFWYLMCFYASWPIILVLINIEMGDLYVKFGFLCTALFVAPLQGFLNFIAYTRQRILRFMKQHSMWTATTVTATSAASTKVNHPHEVKECDSATQFAAASETALDKVQGETKTLDS
jgi:hypothetical protein